jgi:hypothetical protein
MTDDEPSRPSLRVIGGTEAGGTPGVQADVTVEADPGSAYVCTWCALRFGSRASLDLHHADSQECRANQKVSSPLQTRYGNADMVWTQPGEMTLNRVRAATCRHTQPRARLVNAAGQTIGFQCGWCYGMLPDDLP